MFQKSSFGGNAKDKRIGKRLKEKKPVKRWQQKARKQVIQNMKIVMT
jgi:hypothetical protein